MLKHGYAPEEQYDGKSHQGPWTDVYALCATMYRCITGIVPENALLRHKDDSVQPPSKLGVAIAPAQEAALMKGLAYNSEDRFQSVGELATALYAEKAESPNETQLLVGEERTEVLYEETLSSLKKADKLRQEYPGKKKSLKIPVIAAVVAAVVLIGFFALSGRGKDSNKHTPGLSPVEAQWTLLLLRYQISLIWAMKIPMRLSIIW